jgi:hypothetical protein
MTEEQKREILASFRQRGMTAAGNNLFATAKSWNEQYYNLMKKNAADVILADKKADKPENVA